jgi:Mrp family chromosome partitioning ATPase
MYVLDDDEITAKEFRFLKRPLMARVFGLTGSNSPAGRVLMVTSDLPQVGKSFMSLNLAASIAKEQLTNVVLVDADPLRRTLSIKLGIGDSPGVMDVLSDHSLRAEDVLLGTGLPGLKIFPAGSPRPDSTELLASRRADDVLGMLQGLDTMVILDAPPLLPTSEARAAIEKVSHALVVVEAGRSTTSELDTMLKMLEGSKASVSLVLNKAPRSSRAPQLYRYEY